MRRSLAGWFLLVSSLLIALSISLLWLQRVAFTPSADAGTAKAVLGDGDIRTEVATLIASADARVLNQSSAQLREYIDQSVRLTAGAELMGGIVEKAHTKVLGERDRPVRVSPAEQVVIVRDERVALERPITLPVQRITAVAWTNTFVDWAWKIAGGLGLLLLVAGFVTRPEPGERMLALGVGLAGLGVLFPFFGWLVPAVILPAASDDTWLGIFPRLANDSLWTTLIVSIVSLVLGVVIVLSTTGRRQRKQFSSTTLSMGRYR